MEEEAEAVYWQAVQDSLAGRHAAAHAKLRALGCSFALAPAVWDACGAQPHGPQPSQPEPQRARSDGGPAHGQAAEPTAAPAPAAPPAAWVLDGGLPPALVRRLRRAFGPGAAYWRDHAYFREATPFFSYVFALPGAGASGVDGDVEDAGGQSGGGADAAPAAALEAAAVLLQRRCGLASAAGGGAAAGAPPGGLLAGATHVEFWAHTRPLDAPHQLHFDVNEGFLRRGPEAYHLAHPAASSLLFLTRSGGPTIVLDQTPTGAAGRGGGGGGGGGNGEPGEEAVQGDAAAAAQPAKRRRVEGADEAAARPAGGGASAADAAAGARPGDSVGGPLGPEAARHLAARAWLLRPSEGRWAVWPGNLLHGVLPGALQQDDGSSDDGSGGCSGGGGGGGGGGGSSESASASAGAGAGEGRGRAGSGGSSGDGAEQGRQREGPSPWRTTLVLAWWRGDPRDALRRASGAGGAAPGSGSGGGGGTPDEGGSGVGSGGAGGVSGAPEPSWPRPLMEMPSAAAAAGGGGGGTAGGSASGDAAAAAAAGWVRDLALGEGEWESLQADAAAAAAAEAAGAAGGSGTCGGVRAAGDEVAPCWVEVQPGPGFGDEGLGGGAEEPQGGGGPGGGLAAARLPPLRFFLPSADAIEAAYPTG